MAAGSISQAFHELQAGPDERSGLDALAGTPAADFELHCEELLCHLDDALRTIAVSTAK
jgi:hypothetical protein